MRDRNRKVENVRLVRLPDGRLVTQQQAEKLGQKPDSSSTPPTTNITNAVTPKNAPKYLTRRERKAAQAATQKSSKKTEPNILEVWEKQAEIKRESERLELEYQIAKKMAKELRQKIKDRDEPYEYSDPLFKDLLSPETKEFAERLKPVVDKIKETGTVAAKGIKRTAKKSKVVAKIASRKVKNKRLRKPLFALPIVLVVIAGVILIKNKKDQQASSTDVQSAQTQVKSIPLNQTPTFDVLLPAGKTAEQLGGLAKVSPDNSAPAYAYVDKVNQTNIKVTQQELPEAFKVNPEAELEKLAKNFNATKILKIDTTSAYIGKSEKGPQTVIFAKDNLLVFIAAENELPDVSWVPYIAGLQK